MKKELEKTYSPSSFEDKWYAFWEEHGYFKPSEDRSAEPFNIVIPPPNVTGQLHMGHALNNTLQDILIRTKRMQGYNTMWIPGTDHAGIATQIKVEQMLREEKGLSRHDIGRDEFLKLVWAWKEKYGDRIIRQLKKMGSSCDWSRECFTMDENLSAAVRKTFVNLYNKGLIYRGFRIINWCPSCATAISDAEVEHKELEGAFWHIKYKFKDSDEYLIVATTRPETMLGDTAVAVNPEDERYKKYIGKMLVLPLVGREIPVVADEHAKPEFGTGCVKITPCHDPNDFEVALRHDLPMIEVLTPDAKMNAECGKYSGMDRYEARKAIVADLEACGALVRIEKCTHEVGHCYRCGTVLEPTASRQWFVKMKPLAEPAIEVVRNGTVDYIPERFAKLYLNWMENIHDWCISRQLWWGHRIPAYYCDDCGEITVAEQDVTVCPKCGGTHMHQDEDVLDTWFSSALWPFSTLGWPNSTADLDYFYPTSVLVTAYDIITFWVSKMIFMGLENMSEIFPGDRAKQIPFPHVFIHGLVRDAQGRKMSKSLGNGIDPLEIVEKYGADALRFALTTGNSPGNDMRFSDEKIEAARNFANKLWNAARFVLMNLTIDEVRLPAAGELALEDKWILTRFEHLTAAVRENIDSYELGVALGKIYDFVWDIFCDWYIELVKPRLSAGDAVAQNVIAYVLSETLKLLHPFMPFITEEIYQALPHTAEDKGEFIMLQKWPEYRAEFSFPQEEEAMGLIIDAITAIRARRNEMNVAPSKKVHYTIATAHADTFARGIPFFKRLASASDVTVADANIPTPDGSIEVVTHAARVLMPLAELVDFEKELARIAKEKANAEKQLAGIENKLSNQGFIAKAPEAVVNGAREDAAKLRALIEKLDASAAAMKK